MYSIGTNGHFPSKYQLNIAQSAPIPWYNIVWLLILAFPWRSMRFRRNDINFDPALTYMGIIEGNLQLPEAEVYHDVPGGRQS